MLFILALSVLCGKVRDSWITEAIEAFTINSQGFQEESITEAKGSILPFKSLLIFQIIKNFYILIIVIVTIMADKIRKLQKIPRMLP